MPARHLLRSVDLAGVREHLVLSYSIIGRPSTDPELLPGMLSVDDGRAIRSERRLSEVARLDLARRWFRRLGLGGEVRDRSTFPKSRHGRFRDSGIRRGMLQGVLRRRGVATAYRLDPKDSRAVDENVAPSSAAVFGAAIPVGPKFMPPIDPAARWTAS